YRRTGERTTVTPQAVTGTQLRTGAFDMKLVRLRGRLIADPIYRGDTQVLHLNADGSVVNLELRGVGETPLSQLHAGTLVQGVGVCSIGAEGHRQPTSMRLHLRSGNDVLVLEGPPW